MQIEDREAKRGRIETVRFNPREGETAFGAVPAHRGNLNYQDCRRTLTFGYDPEVPDALRADDIDYAATPPAEAVIEDGDNIISRRGVADLPRIGDRQLSVKARFLRHNIVENIIEACRSSIQTAFYTCDYTTKPNMTCAPLLKCLGDGMEGLEATLKEEEDKQRKLLAESTAVEASSASSSKPTTVSVEYEAKRRLCRLWTAANHAMVKGCCLMALELLTNREAIRTHRHWRLFMKRPIWSAESALEKLEQKVDAELPTEMHRLEKLAHTTEEDGTSSTVKLESSDSFL